MSYHFLPIPDIPRAANDAHREMSADFQGHLGDPDPHSQYTLKTDALSTFAFAAYGGMSITADASYSDLGPSYQPITGYTADLIATPRHIATNLVNGTLAFLRTGVYPFSVTVIFEHDSSNQGRTTNLRLWNVTDGAQLGDPFVIPTGRNAEASQLAFTAPVEITSSEVAKAIRLEVGGGDIYTLVAVNTVLYSAWNAGEWRESFP